MLINVLIYHNPIPLGHRQPHLSILHRLQLRVVRRADDLVIVSVGWLPFPRLHAEGVPALLIGQGEELPRRPLLPVQGPLQDPVCRTRGYTGLHQDVSDLKCLKMVYETTRVFHHQCDQVYETTLVFHHQCDQVGRCFKALGD